jgi:ethanolamine utilization protein EutN
MFVGRVIGCVWSSVKDAKLEGHRLLIVQPLTPQLKPTGKRLICADSTGAGAGELIYWTRSREAVYAFEKEAPVDATITGVVDSINLKRT